MKITVFTSNQPRHIALIEKLIAQGFQINAVMEASTICPGEVQDLHQKSGLHARYFKKVLESEKYFFNAVRPIRKINNLLVIRIGDVNFLQQSQLIDFLQSDIYIVFGASYIKGWLCDFLTARHAINIHMGLSPFYRGSSCNFWACYDNNFEYVGATLHLLSRGLDSGKIIKLIHANPKYISDRFLYTMSSVENGQNGLIETLCSGLDFVNSAIDQNIEYQIRYSKKREFTEQHISEYLTREESSIEENELENRIKIVSERFKTFSGLTDNPTN